MAELRSSLASTGDETRHYYFITLNDCINAMISTKAAFIQSTSIQLCAALMILDSLDQHHSDEYWAKPFTDIADDAITKSEILWDALVKRGYLPSSSITG